MGSALYLLSAILVIGSGAPNDSLPDSHTGLQEHIAKTSARLPAVKLPVMADSEPTARALTASDQKSANVNNRTYSQRWTF